MIMRLFFVKAFLIVGIFVFTVVMLDPGLLNTVLHPFDTALNHSAAVNPSQYIANSQDSTPALLRWIYQNLEPVANQVRFSFNQWWETQKTQVAGQISQWLAQQQQNILSGVQTQVQSWINNILGVSTKPIQ
jgi:hypothetical protein